MRHQALIRDAAVRCTLSGTSQGEDNILFVDRMIHRLTHVIAAKGNQAVAREDCDLIGILHFPYLVNTTYFISGEAELIFRSSSTSPTRSFLGPLVS